MSKRQRRDEHDAKASQVTSELELKELADVEVEVPSLHDEAEDASEGIVLEDNVSSLLSYFASLLAHSNAYVSRTQCLRVIAPIASHSHILAQLLQASYHQVLVFWGCSCQHS